MQLIHYIDPHNYGDKEYLQNMVAMFSSPFSQSYSTDIDIYIIQWLLCLVCSP